MILHNLGKLIKFELQTNTKGASRYYVSGLVDRIPPCGKRGSVMPKLRWLKIIK